MPVRRGKHPHRPTAKVSERDVREMRAFEAPRHRAKLLARRYGLSPDHVKKILGRRAWGHVS